jgi:hypothetical protein
MNIKIGTDEFVKMAKSAVLYTVMQGLDPTDEVSITENDIYFVNCSYVLGNIKGWLSTTLPDGKYYEVTYNNEKKEMYVDAYTRIHQEVIAVTESDEE